MFRRVKLILRDIIHQIVTFDQYFDFRITFIFDQIQLKEIINIITPIREGITGINLMNWL